MAFAELLRNRLIPPVGGSSSQWMCYHKWSLICGQPGIVVGIYIPMDRMHCMQATTSVCPSEDHILFIR